MKVLESWGLAEAETQLWAERENRVYRVENAGQSYALRQHRLGLRTPAQIEVELAWMALLADQGLCVPQPQKPLIVQDGAQLYSLITWLPGRPLGHRQDPLDLPNAEQTFEALGRLIARLHASKPAASVDRPVWDAAGLVGPDPLWGRFWEHPDLSHEEALIMRRFAEQAFDFLKASNMPKQLIHADLLQENVLVDGAQVYAIDFDDSAVSYPLFDLTAPLVQRLPDPKFTALRDALIQGYGDVDQEALALLFAVRCCTYLGWVQDKMASPEGKAMSDRIRRRALDQVDLWQRGQSPIF